MSGSSCDCRQLYDISTNEENVKEEEDEEEAEEEETESSEETQETCSLPMLKKFFIKEEGEAEKLAFNELLFIRKRQNCKAVGKICIFADRVGPEVFAVGFRGEVPVEEKIHVVHSIGLVNHDLGVVEQVKEEEHVNTVSGEVCLETLQMKSLKEEGGIVMTETRERNGVLTHRKVSKRTRQEVRDLLSVSANVLLLRQLAVRDFVGKKHLDYLHTTYSRLCQIEYKSFPFRMIKVNKAFCRGKRIRRRVVMPNDEMTEVNAYLSEAGRLLLVTWPGEKFFAATAADLDPTLSDPLPKDPRDAVPLRERLLDHPVLTSILQEEKVRTVEETERYIADHPELSALLSFLAKTLLLYKPHKVVHFVRRNIAPFI